MPVFQYFGWVGSFLIAMLLAANWCFPATIDPHVRRFARSEGPHPDPYGSQMARTRGVGHHAFDAGARCENRRRDRCCRKRDCHSGGRQPFEAFAEMAPPAKAVFSTAVLTPRVQSGRLSPVEKGAPFQNRSRLSMMARKGFTLPSRLHKLPGRS